MVRKTLFKTIVIGVLQNRDIRRNSEYNKDSWVFIAKKLYGESVDGKLLTGDMKD